MTAGTVETRGPASGYRHEAFVYHGEQGFLDGTVPFIRDGLAAGEPVLVAVIEPRLIALRAALGGDARRVMFADMAEMGRNPARIIPAWLQFLAKAGGGTRMRGVGEPVWSGRSEAELAECQLHEALLNRAVAADTNFWLRCPYDADALEPAVIEEAHRSHPLVTELSTAASPTYDGHVLPESIFATALPEPPSSASEFVFDERTLWQLRQEVRARTGAAGFTGDRTADMVLAVHELATNSVRHGSGVGRFRSWREGGLLTFEIADHGRIADPMVGRVPPAVEQAGGRGVWLANQLCDLVQIRSGRRGTTIRVSLSVL